MMNKNLKRLETNILLEVQLLDQNKNLKCTLSQHIQMRERLIKLKLLMHSKNISMRLSKQQAAKILLITRKKVEEKVIEGEQLVIKRDLHVIREKTLIQNKVINLIIIIIIMLLEEAKRDKIQNLTYSLTRKRT